MRLIKKLTPLFSIVSAIGIVTPLVTSCSSKVSYVFDFTKHQQEVYLYKSQPVAEDYHFEWTASEAINNYFNGLELDQRNEDKTRIEGINENKWILMDDVYHGLVSEPIKILLVWYCGIWIDNVDAEENRMSLTWTVKYTLSDPMASSTIIVNTVSVKDIKFYAEATSSSMGVKIVPFSTDQFFDDDNKWGVSYTYEESSPLGLAKRTYVYNKELWRTYPRESLDLVFSNLNYESRYLENVKIVG